MLYLKIIGTNEGAAPPAPFGKTTLEYQMTLSLPGERSIAAASPAHPFALFMRWLAKAQANRARRTALHDLLELEHVRLDDLGIRREDVVAAIRSKNSRPGQALSAARARRAKL